MNLCYIENFLDNSTYQARAYGATVEKTVLHKRQIYTASCYGLVARFVENKRK